MRKATLIACLLFLPMLSGCKTLLFGVFGDYYSGGGSTRADKEDHYTRQFEPSQHHVPWNQ